MKSFWKIARKLTFRSNGMEISVDEGVKMLICGNKGMGNGLYSNSVSITTNEEPRADSGLIF